MTASNIMTVGEMIDTAFGDDETNTVNHKLIQAVLFILARQLRVLDRRVKTDLAPYLVQSHSSLSVTEVKLEAMQKRRKKPVKSNTGSPVKAGSPERYDDTRRRSKRGPSVSGAGSRRGTQVVAYFIEERKGIGGFGGRGGRGGGERGGRGGRGGTGGRGGRSGTDSGGKESETGSRTSDSGRKEFAGRGREKITVLRSSIESSRGRKSSTGEKGRGTNKGSSEGHGKYNSGQTAPDRATDRPVIDETASEKRSRGYKMSQPSSSSEKPKSTSSDKDKSSSTDKPKSSTEKITSDNYDSRSGPTETPTLDEFEIERERILRIVEKRANSRDAGNKTPTPIASMDSFETAYEKLLVVERIPAKEAKRRAELASKGRTGTMTCAKVSIVTQEQFANLVKTVKDLQRKFEPIGKAEFPENIQLMEELRRGASLTDAMAALQLSARLEATENFIQRLTNLLTDLARTTPGVHLELLEGDGMEVLYGPPDVASIRSRSTKPAQQQYDKKSIKSSAAVTPKYTSEEALDTKMLAERSAFSTGTKHTGTLSGGEEQPSIEKEFVTYTELDEGLQEVFDKIMKTLGGVTTKSTVTADEVLKAVTELEERINTTMDLGTKMIDLELYVAQYADKINYLDTGLTSQMTNYQEELTQMQHDLETGLETMAEVLANTGGDTVAVNELNMHFSSLQGDIDHTMFIQKELKDTQRGMAIDLEAIRKQIEILRDIKADRDEVADALRDKADLGALNGIVSLEQFDAVRGDFEKRVGLAYDKFNNQEAVWQKAIEDLLRELNEKADYVQVVGLRDDIDYHLNYLNEKLKFMLDIVGEPKAAAIQRKICRDAVCLSCSAPAHMALEERAKVPALPGVRPPAIGAEAPKQKEVEGRKYPPCYPGLLIPHPVDSRAYVCRRWCGGSHTTEPNSGKPVELKIEQLHKPTTTALGTDGKVYRTDEHKPCTFCNIPRPTPQPSKAGGVGDHQRISTVEHRLSTGVTNQGDCDPSGVTTPDDIFLPQLVPTLPEESASKGSVVPPPPFYSISDNF